MGEQDFGKYLKAQRNARGWTLRHAAKQIGTSLSRLSEIERGQSYHTEHATRPSRELVEKIAQAYELSPTLLLTEAGYPVGPTAELSPEAVRMLSLFEALPTERKRLALGILRLMAEPE
ncbi:Helix-turn-helix domain protein [compost metagenome]